MSPTVTSNDPMLGALLTCVLKGTILLVLVGMLALLSSSASRRHFTWMVGFVALALLLVLDPLVPQWGILPDWRGAGWPQAIHPWVLPVWMVGTGLFLAKVGVGFWALLRIERRSMPLTRDPWENLLLECRRDLGIARSVRLLRFPGRIMPMTWGLVRNSVVLPSSAARWSVQRIRAVLMHELAHVRRRDYVASLLRDAVCALFWFHPLVWWAAREMDEDREEASDDAVLAAGHRPVAYAEHLATVATRGWGHRLIDPSVRPRVALAEKPLLVRVRSILLPWKSRHPMSWTQRVQVVLAVVGLLLAILLVGPDQHRQSGMAGSAAFGATEGRADGQAHAGVEPLLPHSAIEIGGKLGENDRLGMAFPTAVGVESVPGWWKLSSQMMVEGTRTSSPGAAGAAWLSLSAMRRAGSFDSALAGRGLGDLEGEREQLAGVVESGSGENDDSSTAKPWLVGASANPDYSTSPPEETGDEPEGIDIGEVMASFENVGHIGVDDFDLGGMEGDLAAETSPPVGGGFELGEFSFGAASFGIASFNPAKELPLEKTDLEEAATRDSVKVSKDRGQTANPSLATVKRPPAPAVNQDLAILTPAAHSRPDPGLETRVGIVKALSTGEWHLAITFRRKASAPTASFRFEASPDLRPESWDYNPDHFILADVRSANGKHEATIVLSQPMHGSAFRYLRIRSTSARSPENGPAN